MILKTQPFPVFSPFAMGLGRALRYVREVGRGRKQLSHALRGVVIESDVNIGLVERDDALDWATHDLSEHQLLNNLQMTKNGCLVL